MDIISLAQDLQKQFNDCSTKSYEELSNKEVHSLLRIFRKVLDHKEGHSERIIQLCLKLVDYLWKQVMNEFSPISWKFNIGSVLTKATILFNHPVSLETLCSSLEHDTIPEKIALLINEKHTEKVFLSTVASITHTKYSVACGLFDSNLSLPLAFSFLLTTTQTTNLAAPSIALLATHWSKLNNYDICRMKSSIYQALVGCWTGLEPGLSRALPVFIEKIICAKEEEQKIAFDLFLAPLLLSHRPSKGALRCLPSMIKNRGLKKLLESYPGLINNLLQGLSINYSSSVSSDVFIAIFEQASVDDDSEATDLIFNQLEEYILNSSIIRLESGSNDQLCQNFVNDLCRPLCQHLPKVLTRLLARLEVSLQASASSEMNSHRLTIWAALTGAARSAGLIHSVRHHLLLTCLHHPNDMIRIYALSILTNSLRRTSLPTSFSLSLVLSHLYLNLTIGNPSARNRLTTGIIKPFFRRVSDSCVTLVGQLLAEQKSAVVVSVESSDWLVKCCDVEQVSWEAELQLEVPAEDKLAEARRNLGLLCRYGAYLQAPYSIPRDACYQRQKTMINLMEAFWDLFRFGVSKALSKKAGFTLETVNQLITLMQRAAEQCNCSYGDPEVVTWILDLLPSANKDIQNDLIRLLLAHFPIDRTALSRSVLERTFQRSLILCDSSHADQYTAGANILVYILTNLSREVACDLLKDLSVEQFFIKKLDEKTNSEKKTILEMARDSPGHGFLLALDQILQSHDFPGRLEFTDFQLVTTCIQLIRNMVALMGCSQEGEGAASFCQLGESIMTAMKDCQDDLNEEDNELKVELAPDFQHILSWAWNTIKLCSSVLTSWAQLDLSRPDLDIIGEELYSVIIHTRHRGTIEAVSRCLHRYATSITAEESYRGDQETLPRLLLSRCIRQVETGVYSVTRRSAGLPLVLTSLLSACSKGRQSPLLHDIVHKLIAVANDSSNEEHPATANEQLVDSGRVHAINLLKSLVSDAALTNSITSFYSDILLTALDGFVSTEWPVRNSSLQLFSFLITRMLGPDNRPSSLTAEFFLVYPRLLPAFLSLLRVSGAHSAPLNLHQNAVPILTVLKRLAPSNNCLFTTMTTNQTMFDTLQSFLESRVARIRVLAARASLSFIPTANERASYIEQSILTMTSSKCTANRFHSYVVTIEAYYTDFPNEHHLCKIDLNKMLQHVTYLRAHSDWLLASYLTDLLVFIWPFCDKDKISLERMFLEPKMTEIEIKQPFASRYVASLACLQQTCPSIDISFKTFTLQHTSLFPIVITQNQLTPLLETFDKHSEVTLRSLLPALSLSLESNVSTVSMTTRLGETILATCDQLMTKYPDTDLNNDTFTFASLVFRSACLAQTPESESTLKQMTLWIKQLETRNQSRAALSDVIRLNSVEAMRHCCSRGFWKLFPLWMRIKLITFLFHFLIDECEEVRQAACDITREFLPHLPLSNHVLSLRHLMDNLSQLLPLEARCGQWLADTWIALHVEMDQRLQQTVRNLTNPLPFEPDEPNVYREPSELFHLLYRGLVVILKTHNSKPGWFNQLQTCVSKDQNITHIQMCQLEKTGSIHSVMFSLEKSRQLAKNLLITFSL